MGVAPRRLAFGLALTLICSCISAPPPTATPSANASAGVPTGLAGADMTPALLSKAIPRADPFDLVPRLKGRTGTPSHAFEPVRTTERQESVGSSDEFWVYDFAAKKNERTSATLRFMTQSAKWWVASDVTVDEPALERTAQVFQDKIYPTDRSLFGPEWTPGIDADQRIDVLIARIPGAAAGYFSSTDELPRWVNELSAEREMIYVNAISARLGSDNLYSVLAHEFCHMIQFAKRSRSAIWFNEGQAQLCERANGYGSGFEQLFLQQPDTQLDAWTELDQGAPQHYGATYLFLEFLRGRTGGSYAFINTLMSHGVDTLADIDAALRAAGYPGIDDVLADFAAANALIGSSPPSPFTYPEDVRVRQPARPASADRLSVGGDLRSSVHPEAARYVGLPSASAYHVHFEAPSLARIVPTDPHSGQTFWWSDRADLMDSTMTHEVDLTGVRRASLSFWTWYELEKDFDYSYIEVSSDGGARWTTVPTEATTAADPNGDNLGNGLTGVSGGGKEPAWVQQHADLTPFAGRHVLLRLENVTDPALNLNGFAVQDIEIPEIGYRDDAQTDDAWDAKGFIRSTNTIRERYMVQLIRFGATPTVERHLVEGGTLDLDVDARGDSSEPELVVMPLAARTTEVAPFEVRVTPKG
jgi:immune inhibitor A